ncbi:otoraplin [Zootoca vivipara]|uniref:otoraplin n=1 Tax=Zootoca vivipara TaxID=8524 RepID=UPI00293BFE93|nr:otoraplin [Zootoca vivipara]
MLPSQLPIGQRGSLPHPPKLHPNVFLYIYNRELFLNLFLLCKAGRARCLGEKKMPHTVGMLMFLLCLGFTFPMIAKGIFMDKLASKKLCADQECLYAISLARAEDDYNAPDCRFINVKKGQLIYIYSKLVQERGAGEFWAGSVYAEHYEDQMGTVGYFPRNLVTEQHIYQEANETVSTKAIDFFCE